MADTRGLTLIRMHALKKNPAFLYTCIMLAGSHVREVTNGEKKATFILSSLQTCEGTDSSYFNRVWGGFFNCLSPTRVHTLSLTLHLAGSDIKASLLLAEMERRSFSISNRASFLCFEKWNV